MLLRVNMNPIIIYISLIIGGILLTCGDLFMKSWAVTDKYFNYGIGILFWVIGSLFLAWTYKFKNMAVATIIYIFINVATLLLVSWIYYKEPLTAKQMIGVGLGLTSLFLLE